MVNPARPSPDVRRRAKVTHALRDGKGPFLRRRPMWILGTTCRFSIKLICWSVKFHSQRRKNPPSHSWFAFQPLRSSSLYCVSAVSPAHWGQTLQPLQSPTPPIAPGLSETPGRMSSSLQTGQHRIHPYQIHPYQMRSSWMRAASIAMAMRFLMCLESQESPIVPLEHEAERIIHLRTRVGVTEAARAIPTWSCGTSAV